MTPAERAHIDGLDREIEILRKYLQEHVTTIIERDREIVRLKKELDESEYRVVKLRAAAERANAAVRRRNERIRELEKAL